MNREELAEKIHWSRIIWVISIINPLMTLPQLIQIWQTHQTAGISMVFLLILLLVQGGFSLHGYFTRDRFIMGSNGIAAAMTLITILSVVYFRSV